MIQRNFKHDLIKSENKSFSPVFVKNGETSVSNAEFCLTFLEHNIRLAVSDYDEGTDHNQIY